MEQINTLVNAAREKKITEEDFLFHQQICRELDETRKKTQDPLYQWLTEDEFWQRVNEGVKKATAI